MSRMDIIITGGTGFIGSRLAIELKAQGHSIKVLGLQKTEAEEENAKMLLENEIQILNINLLDRQKVLDALVGVNIVFHFAAVQHEMNVPDKKFRDVNVEATRNLLELCVELGIKKFIHGSTIGVYGRLEGEIDEESPCNPDNVYGVTKLEGEKVVLSFRNKINVSVVRIPETYGPGDYRLIKLFKMINNNTHFTIGNGKNLHHSIFIDDLIKGFLQVAESNKCGGEILLFAGEHTVSTETMYKTIADALGTHVPNIHIPYSIIYIVAYLSEIIFRPLGIQPPIYRRRIDFFRKSFSLSSKKAQSLIKFNPTTCFKDGIAKTANWYRNKGFIKSHRLETRTSSRLSVEK